MRLARLISVLTMLAAAFCAMAQYDIDQFFILGQMALNEGQYLQAINNFNVLVRLDPSLHQAYFLRGIAKYNLGDFGGAETDFDKSIEINPIDGSIRAGNCFTILLSPRPMHAVTAIA